jgi:phage-related baseplate assembly protein
MLSISDLLSPVTTDQVRAKFVSMLIAVGIPADKWRKGGVASSILTVVAATYASFSVVLVQALSGQFLSQASGGWLTLLAIFVYGVTRRSAVAASGPVTLSNTGGGIYIFGPGQVTVQNSSTKETYTNVDPINLGPGTPSLPTTQTANFVAQDLGALGSAVPGAIDTLVTAMVGVTVTNPIALIGIDEQQDDDLRAQCLNKLAALSVRGPRGAYAYAVRQLGVNPTTGQPLNINRVSVSPSSHTGIVTVTVASPTGPVTADDMAGAATSIEANARPDAVTVVLNQATPVLYNPALTIWAQALPGVAAPDIKTAADAAIAAFISAYPINGIVKGLSQGLFGTGIDAEVGATNPAIFAIDGATDLALTTGQVATNGVTTVVRLVPPS